MGIGGIASFIRGFVKYAPPDFTFGMVGVSAKRPIGEWQSLEFEGRSLAFLPILRAETTRRSRIPLALRFAGAGLRWRRRLDISDWTASLHRPGSDLVLPARRGAVWRVVHLAREDMVSAGGESRWQRLPVLLDFLEDRAFRRMARIYVVNRHATDRYRRRYPDIADRVRFLPNWADDGLFSLVDPSVRQARREELFTRLGLPPASELVVYAGRLDGQKDPLLLADVFSGLHRRRPTACLLVAGDGSLRPQMERRLRETGAHRAARVLGVVTRGELARIMSAADAMLITSRFETGPTVGLEALASGLPVVTTPVGEVGRLIGELGRGGEVSPSNATALAEATFDVLDRSTEAARREAAAVAEPYRASQVLGQLYEELREMDPMSGK